MKKQFLSVVTVLGLCLSLLPPTVLATDETGSEGESAGAEQPAHVAHCICGAAHTAVGDHTTESLITDWTGVDELADITASGHYYLTGDTTLEDYWQEINNVDDDVVLCLNGHTITVHNTKADDYIRINHGKLTLTDCKGGGAITSSGNYGKVVRMLGSDSVLNLYAASIKGISVGSQYYGGGVRNTGTFNMYSGSIENNYTAGYASRGAGVYNDLNSTFQMYGGTIKNNIAFSLNSGLGNDVYVTKGSTFYANSGTVAGEVINEGTITVSQDYTGTTFGGDVENKGTIEDGSFRDSITNSGTIRGGTFQSVTNSGTIAGGTFNHMVINNNTITGGTFNQMVTNEGTITGGTFCSNAVNRKTIKGGSFCYMSNSGTITGASFSENMINSGTIDSCTFLGTVTNTGTISGSSFQKAVINNGVIVFKDERAYAENKSFIVETGTGCVQVGTGDTTKYYLCDGTPTEGTAVYLTEEGVFALRMDTDTATLVVASYKGNTLDCVKLVSLTSNIYKKSFSELGLNTSGTESVKAFIWTDMEAFAPLCVAQEVALNK